MRSSISGSGLAVFHEQLLTKAFKGEVGQAWCISANYNYEAIRKKLMERMKDSDEWHQLRFKMDTGKALDTNVDMMIAHFKGMIYALDRDLESEETKELFIRALPLTFHPDILMGPDGKYKSFSELEKFVQRGRKGFEEKGSKKRVQIS